MMSKQFFLRKIRGFFMQSCRILLFLAVMLLIFYLTFNVIGKALSDLLAQGIDAASALTARMLLEAGAPAGLSSLLLEGIFPGVGSVLSFVPVIGTLFFFLSLLEESGVMSRAAYLLDAPMRRIGLSGQAVIPMIMGFGCNVPAIMTAGALLKGREKAIVIMLIPFLSCSAKLPVYALFISAFFPDDRLAIIGTLYLAGIAVAILLALLMKRISVNVPDKRIPDKNGDGNSCAHAACRSRHRFSCKTAPRRFTRAAFGNAARSICRTVLQSCAGFIKKAFTVILMASVIVWFLRTFDANLAPASDIESSLLAYLGKWAAPLFAPLGFGNWIAASALISGLFAKEAVVSTLAVISGPGPGASAAALADSSAPMPPDPSAAMLAGVFTPLSAFSFMVFCLLYIPCIATIATVRQETGSLRYCLLLMMVQMITAWTVSFLVFQAGTFIMQL